MSDELTLMAVHAHPDDEVIGTGGVFARYAAEGLKTVLVTCTNGEQGDGPDGVKPGEPGHDERSVARLRLDELRESMAYLGIENLELLGYRDSGMAGWDTNDHPDAFANVPVGEAAERLAALIDHYRPHVVVTYDENGGYGHPDHIHAHKITLTAVETSDVPCKLYYTAVPRGRIRELFEYLRESGMDLGGAEPPPPDFGTPDELITTVVDVSPFADRKRNALKAHASQSDSAMLLNLPEEMQRRVFSQEAFVRRISRVAAPETEDDLFAGLR